MAMLFITHNLGVVRIISDEIVVLREGRVCEAGPTEQILRHPADPYTRGLVAAVLEVA